MRLLLPGTATVGKKAVLHIVSDEPGAVALQYSGPVSGPATVTVPGARQYRYGGNPAGQYAARLLSSGQGQDRSPASWLLRLRPEDLAGACAYQMAGNASGAYYGVPLLWCAQPAPGANSAARINWMVSSYWSHGIAAGSFRAAYPLWASPSPTANPSQYTPLGIEYGDAKQYATACVLTLSGSTLTRYMLGPNGTMQTATASCSLADTMGGTEVICAQWPFEQFLKYSRAVSSSEAQNWLLYGAIPSDPQIAYLGGHEIDGPQRVYDSGPMGLHLGEHDMSQYPGTGFGAPVCAHRYVETSPVQPVEVEIEPSGTGSATIAAKRTRVGVPTSRPDSERFETTTITLEAEAAYLGIGPDVSASSLSWPIIRRVAVFAETDDPVSLSSDDVRVTVPASVTPVDGLALVEVTILAPVSCVTLEATQGTAAADCSVTATEAPPVPVPEIEPNDTLNLFPRWLHTEPHAIGLSAVLDFARAEWTDTMLPSLLIYDVDNQTSEILDLVAEAFSVYGWNKAAGEAEKIAFLRNSLKIQRKIGTGYAVKQAIRLVCDVSKIEDIIIHEGTGGIQYDGSIDFDGSENFDSHYHWARFDVEIETTDAAYFTAAIKATITAMINHYKPASRWLENLIITEI